MFLSPPFTNFQKPSIFTPKWIRMTRKKEYSFPMMIIAFILGLAIFRQFDFEKMKFEQPVLVTVYFITFIMAIYFIFKR